MHDERQRIGGRVSRVLAQRLRPAVHAERVPLALTAWQVPGEPVPVAEALAATYGPFAVGERWGPPWSTTWVRATGTVPAGWAGRRVEAVFDLGFDRPWPGFSAEGLVHTPDGVPVKGIEPRNQAVPLLRPAAGGEGVDLLLELAANPDVLLGGFTPTPLGDVLTAPTDPLSTMTSADLAVLDEQVWHLVTDVEAGRRRARTAAVPDRHAAAGTGMTTAVTSPWARHVATLDPLADHATIVRLLSRYEFPWDFQQALSFALFRTFAVPSIGALLHTTGEFTRRTQKRYDDTALLLDAILEHGPTRGDGREALRRMNRMHGAYAIAAEDLRYVLCTFVTMPIRWVDAYGHRRLTPGEQLALATSYRELGLHMGIADPPSTPQEFADHLDAYEAARFGYSDGGRAVADATLDLFATFPPFGALPGGARLSRAAAYALMDDPLLDALRYPRPARGVRAAVRGAVRARGLAVRALPPRSRPKRAQDFASVRGYPGGVDVRTLGTFPPRG